MNRPFLGTILLACAVLLPSCAGTTPFASAPLAAWDDRVSLEIEVRATQSVSNIGAGQGVMVHDGFVYLYGDNAIIREFRFDESRPALLPTGRRVRLTAGGKDVGSQPSGLTVHPELGAFLGDTVNQQSVIHSIDWARALEDGDLDNAIINSCEDDLAVHGCRPEFVEHDGRWLVASTDSGATGNQVRLYHPKRLSRAALTSEPGVLYDAKPCAPFVRTLSWIGDRNTLVLVQNQTPGLGSRLTPTLLSASDLRVFRPTELELPPDELAGFSMLTPPAARGWAWAVLLSASREQNVHLARVRIDRVPSD